MSAIRLRNPFVTGYYEGEEYFCDRKDEVALLQKHVDNGRHVTLISPRRLGKTGLIEHFFAQSYIKKEYYTFFVDIYATTSLSEFVALMGKEIFKRLKPVKTKWGESFLQMVSSLRPGVKMDSMTGDFTLELGLGDIQSAETTLDEIFDYLECADRHCIVAIDEFQQITCYDEKNVEALLRTKIQHCKNVTFIYTGSSRHMISQMFHSQAKPFYQSAIGISLKPIPKEVYRDFVCDMFSKYDKRIQSDVVDYVYDKYEGYTWYMQMMMNELFALTVAGEECDMQMISTAHANIIVSQEDYYRETLTLLATKQKMLLLAMAKEYVKSRKWIKGITSSDFIKKYKLPSASSVQSALRGLIDKNIVSVNEGSYRISDFFLTEWCATYL